MITSKTIAFGILRAVGILVFASICLYLMYQIQTIFVYLISALVLSLISSPIVRFLNKRFKFSNLWAVITTLLLILFFIIGFVLLFIPLLSSLNDSLNLLNTNEIQAQITEVYNQFSTYLAQRNLRLEEVLKESNLTSKLDFSFLPSVLNSLLGTLTSFGMGIASVLFITFFFLKDKETFVSNIKKILPLKQETKILNSIQKTKELLTRYFVGLLLQLTIVFILYYIVLLIFDINHAFIIAFICAVLNIIPYVGPLIGAVFASSLALIGNLGNDFQTEILPTTIYVLIGFFIVQLIDNNVNQPLIFSKSVKSHPLEIFLVILIAGFLSGIIGMIIAIPFYTILKVTAKEFFPNNKIVKVLTQKL